jgi:hypothetical protein
LEAVALWDVHMAVNSARELITVPFVNCKLKFCALYLTLLVTFKLWHNPKSDSSALLTCICLRRRLFRVNLEISRTVINLAYRDIVTSQRGHWPLLIRTRYVCTCVSASSGMGGEIRKIKAIHWGAYYYSLVLNAQPCKYDMYKSNLRHTWSGTFIIKDERYTFLFYNV